MIDERIDEALRRSARDLDVDWREAWLGPRDGETVAHPAAAAHALGLPVLQPIDHATPTTALEPVRRRPAHASEMITEVRGGERVQRLLREGDWWLVAGEDRYVGWVHDWVLVAVDDAQWERWHERRLGHFDAPLGTLWTSDHHAAAPLVLGTPLLMVDAPVQERRGHRLVATTSGGEGWLEVARIDVRVVDDPVRTALNAARMLLGTPYRWGGRSPMGFDCSGLVQYVAQRAGVDLPRDAAQQQRVGEDVGLDPARWQAGDLLFFGEVADHVGIFDGREGMIHCRAQVRRDPLRAIAPLMARLSAVRRPWSLPSVASSSLWRPRSRSQDAA